MSICIALDFCRCNVRHSRLLNGKAFSKNVCKDFFDNGSFYWTTFCFIGPLILSVERMIDQDSPGIPLIKFEEESGHLAWKMGTSSSLPGSHLTHINYTDNLKRTLGFLKKRNELLSSSAPAKMT